MYYTSAFSSAFGTSELVHTFLPPICIETPSRIQRWSAGPLGRRACSSPSTPYISYLSQECMCDSVCVCARGGSAPQCSVGPRQHKVTSNDSSLYDLFIYYTDSARVCRREEEEEERV